MHRWYTSLVDRRRMEGRDWRYSGVKGRSNRLSDRRLWRGTPCRWLPWKDRAHRGRGNRFDIDLVDVSRGTP